MFGDPKWSVTLLSSICELKAGKFISAADIKAANGDGLFPCYGGNGLRGYVNKFTHDGCYSLIGRQGALCGNVKYVEGKFYATEHAVVVRPIEILDSLWLSFFLREQDFNKLATGAAQPGIAVEMLNRVDVSLPPLQLQNRFADFVRHVDKSKFEVQRGLKKMELLRDSLMQQYFG